MPVSVLTLLELKCIIYFFIILCCLALGIVLSSISWKAIQEAINKVRFFVKYALLSHELDNVSSESSKSWFCLLKTNYWEYMNFVEYELEGSAKSFG